jgi:hypothetical protein
MKKGNKTVFAVPEVRCCFVCGSNLEAIGLVLLQCSKDDCGEVFLLFKDVEGRQNVILINPFSK